jgi:hypothetical protein
MIKGVTLHTKEEQMTLKGSREIKQSLGTPGGIALLVFLTIAAFFLITEHTAHLYGVLPYALFLLCPLMHLFMHGGHGGHGDHANHDVQRNRAENLSGSSDRGES